MTIINNANGIMPGSILTNRQKGDRYYTLWGEFLGIYGTENKIRVYTGSRRFSPSFEHRPHWEKLSDLDIIYNTYSFDSIPEYRRLIIIQKIAKSIGIHNVELRYIPGKMVSDYKGEDSGYLNHRSGTIMIDPNSPLHKEGHFYNILLTLCHEKYHYDHHYRKGFLPKARDVFQIEYETYQYIYNHPLFNETTYDYQGMVLNEMYKNAFRMESLAKRNTNDR